ncbi:uncharacterized protein LOC116306022 [Actinia tenebrosa]|uniref:Uncharacterized protein LOC116306022 n=1 Tax=Actinia tenebrosa TaxID=6105 RepID=A0A6P8J2M5_ACTTE|nr:uncharacterized protein LOC116306022 [Actinia tenebrosa]
MYVVKNPDFKEAGVNFVLERWKAGSQIGIGTIDPKKWLSFRDDGDGDIDVYSASTSQFPIPNVSERYSIEIISKECVETPFDQLILAAPEKTSADDCEKLPDRCFLSLGWDYRMRQMQPGYCYYRKGSMCFKPSQRYKDVRYKNPKDCESNGLCWDYLAKYCYLGVDPGK